VGHTGLFPGVHEEDEAQVAYVKELADWEAQKAELEADAHADARAKAMEIVRQRQAETEKAAGGNHLAGFKFKNKVHRQSIADYHDKQHAQTHGREHKATKHRASIVHAHTSLRDVHAMNEKLQAQPPPAAPAPVQVQVPPPAAPPTTSMTKLNLFAGIEEGDEDEEEEDDEDENEGGDAHAVYAQQMAEYEAAQKAYEEQVAAHALAETHHAKSVAATSHLGGFQFKNKVHRQSIADYHEKQRR
jgi:hypothetical protein